MENTNESNEMELTLYDLWPIFRKCFVVMIIAAIVFGSLVAVGVAFLTPAKYSATATFQAFKYTAKPSDMIMIADNCVQLIESGSAITEIVDKTQLDEKLGYTDRVKCENDLRKMIKAKKDKDSFYFDIVVEASDPKTAFIVISNIQAAFPDIYNEGYKSESNNGADSGSSDSSNVVLNNFVSVTKPVNSEEDVKDISTSPIEVFIIVAVVTAIIVFVVYLVRYLLDNVVYSEDTLKNKFSQPVIGVIPNWVNTNSSKRRKMKRDHKNGIDMSERDYTDRLLSGKTPFAITEAFNQLRTNIVFAGGNAKGVSIGVTSAISGAGKSLISANLALSLSNLGKKVLLLECDMRCPVLNKVFKLPETKGLSELLAEIEVDYKELVLKDSDCKIDIITSGKIPPNPSELLSSQKMADLMNQWRGEYDVIICDMPPVNEVVDAGVMSALVSGYILVARCEYSNIPEIKRAIGNITSYNGKIFGFVVNDFNPKNVSKYARSYYNPEDKYVSSKIL